ANSYGANLTVQGGAINVMQFEPIANASPSVQLVSQPILWGEGFNNTVYQDLPHYSMSFVSDGSPVRISASVSAHDPSGTANGAGFVLALTYPNGTEKQLNYTDQEVMLQ